ncbi:GNAT family N-acetyltransferase [Paenibacillus methanolicus]|uniref:RimJ/RimL family protein N-acetyltransferase n=1 Tax=Paenibacillus methanolicus TaxID=582686 RepID=A0A5S5BN48_9BACL|nr:GNAT family N-acetyltransferase [Paenibacillus methanolicus]TYP68364.1 RimJ/RimL family protein N-acetyltransferase [Paenibacillus methanolicus]
MAVELHELTKAHEARLRMFELPPEQAKFTAMPVELLESAPGRYPIVITAGEEPVGFFLLHDSERVKDCTENPRAMLLTAFSVDNAKQGKGYAKQGMALIPAFAKERFPDCDEIVLAVNRRNIPAQKLYERVGFADTGRRRIGPQGEQFVYGWALAGRE